MSLFWSIIYFFRRDVALKPQMAPNGWPKRILSSFPRKPSLGLRWWKAFQASSTEDREPNVEFTSGSGTDEKRNDEIMMR